jgi:hypothetical protein
MTVLDFLIDKIEYIYFINFDENSLLYLLDNSEKITLKLLELIFKILSKSNINKLKDLRNENILFKLLKLFKPDIHIISKFIQYFDIFEQNNDGNNIYNLLNEKYSDDIKYILTEKYMIDSTIPFVPNNKINIIPINYNFEMKHYLKYTNTGLFIADTLHNMIYTYIILEHFDNLLIPNIEQSHAEYKQNMMLLIMSNNDKDILQLIKYYFYNFNSFLPHVIIWKDKTNYFIYPQLIDWLKNNMTTKRFIYIKLSIIVVGGIRHANQILIDNLKKTVERFEPYGEIYFSNCNELNDILKQELADKIKYKFIFVQSYPGFQIRSNEVEENNKIYGDPDGYCLAWCFVYLELKLHYENVIIDKLKKEIKDKTILDVIINTEGQIIKLINNYIINKFKNDFPNITNDGNHNWHMFFIRFYGKYLDKLKNKLIKKYGINVSSIYYKNINTETSKKIITNLNSDIKNIIKNNIII